MNSKVNLAHFSKVFKERIYLRSKKAQPSEIVLLDAFKYYDIKRSGICDYKLFSNVLKRKFEMNMFSEQEIQYVFDYYCQFLEGENSKSFSYKDFIALFLNVSNVRANNTVRDKSMTKKTNRTLNINPEKIESVVEFLLMKGKKREFGFFFRLYKSMYTYRKELDEQKLQQVFQKYNINLNQNELQNLIYFFDGGNQKIKFYKLWDVLSTNFNSNRKQQVREMFSRLDFRNANFVNLDVLQQLFLPKNFYKVQQGLISLNQIALDFNKYVEDFIYFVQNQNVDIKDFILFFQMISIQIDKDNDFKSYIQNCFRYNDVKQMSFQNSYQKDYKKVNKKQFQPQQNISEESILNNLDKQLKEKGQNSYLNFYFRLKKNDFQKDGYLFYEDFYQVIQNFDLKFSEKETKILFQTFCGNGTKLNYDLLLESLVPFFSSYKCKSIKLIFQKLNSTNNQIRFEKIQDYYNPQYHPDVITNELSPGIAKKEFIENLQQFLVFYKGNHLQIDQDSFTRFLEYYTRDWENKAFKNFIENSFEKQQHQNFNHFQNVVNKPPFATNYPSSDKFKKKIGNNKLYEEFSQQKKSDYKFKSPYHVDEISQKRSNYSIRKSRRTQKLDQIEKSQRTHVSQITRQSKSIRSYLSKPSNKKIHEINLELQKHHKPSENQSQHNQEIPETSPIQKLRQTIRNSGDFSLMLEYEYALTNASNLQGEISKQDFIKVSKELKCIQNLTEDELKVVFKQLKEGSAMHVQTFANYIRDQMSEDEEVLTIDLFDRLCAKYHSEVLDINKFKNCFLPKNFTYAKGTTSHIQDMFNFTIDLFEALNITIKNISWIDLDDFLYLFDNFTFYFNDIKKFGDMLNRCFR